MEYKLSNFEGPLDLLLFMLSKNKINIEDIFISDIVNQFIEITKKETNLDDMSDFVLMSSKLIYIKSKKLVKSDSEEVKELERDLIDRLEEYQRIKEISNVLGENYDYGINYFCKSPIIFETEEIFSHSAHELFECAREILERNLERLPPSKEEFSEIIETKELTVTEIYDKIGKFFKKITSFKEILLHCDTKTEMIVAFLLILDMCKQEKVTLTQENDDIILKEISHA